MNDSELNSLFYQRPDSAYIMGILNLDSASFFKNSIVSNIEEALPRVQRMIDDGMDILDLGGFSSRPGMKIPSYEEERSRIMPILKAIRNSFQELLISVDTMRADIASEAIQSGVEIINDISAGNFDSLLPKVVGDNKKVYIAMHMKGLPENMMNSENTNYANVLHDIITFFSEKIKRFHETGLTKIIIDPGFGFSKSITDNYSILNKLNVLEILDKPILVGISRKSMIWKTINTSNNEALIGTLVAEFYAVLKGCNIVRVHDVKETKEMLNIFKAINGVNESVNN